ncbi:MAG TPA: hypothetical protein VF294_07695 [Polyangiaceae bacterium]
MPSMPPPLRTLLPTMLPALLAVATGCTTLGPMASTTGVAMAPTGRPDLTLQGGFVPGYYLSSAVSKDANGTPLTQVGATLEPDRLIGVPGLFVGARYAGDHSTGASVEPVLGYRAALGADRGLGLGLVAYGTHASASRSNASYSATRGGVEAGGDLRLFPPSRLLELHLTASAALTGLSASGSYCIDRTGTYGEDCPDGMPALTNARVSGFYPSLNGGFALDFAEHLHSVFHGVRLAFGAGGGTMPRVIAGEQRAPRPSAAGGATLSIALGGK